MNRKYRLLLLLTVLKGLLAPCTAGAQSAEPPKPWDLAAIPNPLPGLPQPPEAPPSLMRPATPLYTCEDFAKPYFVQDPLLDPPNLPQPGWFADVEVGVMAPHIVGVQFGTVQIGANAPNNVFLPATGLDWTVAPKVQFGYRLPSGFGEFALSWRGLSTTGTDSTLGLDGPAALASRLDFNVVDADYLSYEFSLLPQWDMKWHAGVRVATLYYDARSDEPFAVAAAGSGVFEQRFSNSWWGIGPHFGVELRRQIEGTGLSLMTRIDGATMLGRIRQGFFEQSTTLGVNGLPLTGENRDSGSQDVPVLNIQAGITWQPSAYPEAQFFLGYEYEQWWNIGKLSNAGTAAALYDQGFLVRFGFNY